jgi:flagellar hook-associated protein 2
MSLNKAAANAQATINGIQVQSTTNTFDNVADGLTFTVGKVSSSEVAVTVGDDTASMETAVKSFVTAFNSLASYIKDQTKYVPSTTKGSRAPAGRCRAIAPRSACSTSCAASSTPPARPPAATSTCPTWASPWVRTAP